MNSQRLSILGMVCTLLTVIMTMAWIFPVYWIAATALKSETETIAVPPTFVPSPPDFDAFIYVVQKSPIFRWYLNTIVVSVSVTFCTILFSLMCASALSRLGFMLLFGALAIPLFMQMNKLNLVNSYLGVILPQIATPLTVIVFKQFFDEVPRDFRDAAMIDGASDAKILFGIYLPMNWSITWAMSIVTFIGTWNNFLWPLIITNSTTMLTIPVGMTQIQSAYGIAFAKTSAIAVMASIPTAAAYLIFQKRVTQGVMAAAGLK